jgi:hypothetical protein
MKTITAICVVWTALGSVASTQTICNDNEAPLPCVRRLHGDLPTPAAAAEPAKKDQAEAKKKTETGELDPVTGLTSSVKDFLPLLRLTGVLGDFTQDDETGVISVALNTPLIGSNGLTKDPQFQLRALIETKPKLFGPLRQALPADTRDDIEKKLVDVTNRQNVTLELSYNITSQYFGRSFAQYGRLFDRLFEALFPLLKDAIEASDALYVTVTDVVTTPRQFTGSLRLSAGSRTIVRDTGSWLVDGFDRDVRYIKISGTKQNDGIYEVGNIDGNTVTAAVGAKLNDEAATARVEVLDDSQNPMTTVWRDLPAPKRARIAQAIAAGQASGALKLTSLYNDTARKYGLDVFGQLVLNQPQLHFTFSRAFRDALYGPESLSGRVTYEVGLGNSINSLKSQAEGSCDNNARADAAACLKALGEFAGSETTKASIKAATRLALFGEFQRLGSYTKELTEHNISVAFGKGTSWSFGVDLGRLIAVEADGTASARMDVSGRYERPANTFVGNERGVFSVTLTKKFGDISVPFGLVYATKPEFLKDVDHALGASVGLKFNLFPGIR